MTADWSSLDLLVAEAVRRTDVANADPATCAVTDQARARLRDNLDGYGIDVADPAMVHALIVGAILCSSAIDVLAAVGHPSLRRVVLALSGRAVVLVTTSLADHIPAEARP